MAMTGMRAFAKSKWAAVIFGGLIVAFGFGVGIQDPFSGVVGGGFVQAGDRHIGVRDANRILQRQLDAIREERGETMTQREAAERGLTGAIVQQMIQETTTLAYGDKRGVAASPKAVTDLLINNAPRFKDSLGRINLQAVAEYANEIGYTLEQFQDQLRDSLTLSYLDRAVDAGIAPPDILSKPLATLLGERRSFAFARLTANSVSKPAEPTEEELKTFYAGQSATFAVPERRRISILTYSPSDFIDKSGVTEAQVRNEYQRRIRDFSSPETRVFAQFSSTDRNAIQTVVDTAKQGVALPEAVKKAPGVELIDLTVKPVDITDKKYSDLVFALPLNEVYGPVQVGEAWYGVMVKSVTPGIAIQFEQVADSLRTELASREARRLFNDTAEDFTDLVGAGATLEEISEEIGAPVIQLPAMDINGVFNGMRSELYAQHQEAMRHMFEVKVGESSEVIEADDERAVLRLDEIVPQRTPELAEVRDRARDLYLATRLEEAAMAAANTVATAAKAGTPIDKAATDARLAIFRPAAMTRQTVQQGTYDEAVLDAAFKMNLGDVQVVKDRRGEPWVVKLEKIEAVDPTKDAALMANVANQIKQSVGQDVREVFGRGLQREVKVKVNDKAIQEYLASFTRDDQ